MSIGSEDMAEEIMPYLGMFLNRMETELNDGKRI